MNGNTAISSERSEEKYSKVFQLSSDLLSISTFKDGRFLEVNNALLKTLGFAREEIIGKTALELGLYVNPADRQKLLEAAEKNKPPWNVEIQFRVRDGTVHDGLFSAAKLSINNEDCWLVSITDVSALKLAERELRNVASRYRYIVEDQSELICRYKPDGKLSFVNEAYARYFGKNRAELIGRNYIPHIPEPDLALIARQLARISRDNPRVTFEHRVIMPGGEVRWQHWNHVGIYADGGKLLEYQAVGRDITDQKKVEKALRESEARFLELFNRMTSGVAVYEAIDNRSDFIFRDFNPATEKIEKINRKEILGKRVSEVFPGVKTFGIFKAFQRVWQTGKPEYFPENIYIDDKNPGSWRENWVFKLPDGEIVAIYNDITERKRAERVLIEAVEDKFRTIFDHAQDGILVADLEKKAFSMANNEICRMLGYSLEEITRLGVVDIHPEKDLPYVLGQFERQTRGELSLARDMPVKRKDGSVFYADINAAVVTISGKKCLLGFFRDITERKRAEAELRESEGRYRALLEASSDLIYVIDREDKVQYVNPAALKVLRRTVVEVVGKPRAAFFPQAVAARQKLSLDKVFATGGAVVCGAGNRNSGNHPVAGHPPVPAQESGRKRGRGSRYLPRYYRKQAGGSGAGSCA